MKIDKELEIDFIRVIQKIPNKLTVEEKDAIYRRRASIYKHFEWTQEVDNKIMLLNKRLREEEMRVFKEHRKLEKQCQKMVENGKIDDFELEIEWSCWNYNHYIKYDESIDGNPFYKNNCVGDFMTFQLSEEYFPNCHNTISCMFQDIIPRNSAIITEPHCYMFHHLYDHCPELTWFDIYNIEEVWIEIKVNYQFSAKIEL